jgi:hypothetical protein
MACTGTKIVLGCKSPHDLDAFKWKAIGRRRYLDKRPKYSQQLKHVLVFWLTTPRPLSSELYPEAGGSMFLQNMVTTYQIIA